MSNSLECVNPYLKEVDFVFGKQDSRDARKGQHVFVDLSFVDSSTVPQILDEERGVFGGYRGSLAVVDPMRQLQFPDKHIARLEELKQQLQTAKDDETRNKLVACLKAAALVCLLGVALGGGLLGVGLAAQGICLLAYVVGSVISLKNEEAKLLALVGGGIDPVGCGCLALGVILGAGAWIPAVMSFYAVKALEDMVLATEGGIRDELARNNASCIERLATRTIEQLNADSKSTQDWFDTKIPVLQELEMDGDVKTLRGLQQKLLTLDQFNLQIRERISTRPCDAELIESGTLRQLPVAEEVSSRIKETTGELNG